MKPYVHSKIHVRKWGGKTDDYLPIDNFLDQTKAAHPDMKHRALLHNSMGPFIAEQVFGVNITNSDGKEVSVRDICEEHIMQDLGFIPSVTKWLDHMEMPWWAAGKATGGKFRNID